MGAALTAALLAASVSAFAAQAAADVRLGKGVDGCSGYVYSAASAAMTPEQRNWAASVIGFSWTGPAEDVSRGFQAETPDAIVPIQDLLRSAGFRRWAGRGLLSAIRRMLDHRKAGKGKSVADSDAWERAETAARGRIDSALAEKGVRMALDPKDEENCE